MKNKIFKPPMNISERDFKCPSVFLAGSIENNTAIDWQRDMSKYFELIGYNIFNPRRDDYDTTLEQKITNSNFYQQANWELNALETADIILMYFDPNTKSPISLLELGLFATSGKLHVICEYPFWRKGNVDIVCNKYNIPMYENLDEFKKWLTPEKA
jgi:hypothetical protein